VQTAINKEKQHLKKSKIYRDVGAQQGKVTTPWNGEGLYVSHAAEVQPSAA
jgi:hypothetical protein